MAADFRNSAELETRRAQRYDVRQMFKAENPMTASSESTEPKSMPGLPPGYDGVAVAKGLLRSIRAGALGSLSLAGGFPFATLVNVATDMDGAPILLMSGLSAHTKNLLADPRASLMVAELPATGDALTGARVTIMGRFAKIADEALNRRYLARHPAAAFYSGFGDFAFWRLEPIRAHAVAGFGRIETMDANEVFPSAAEMIALEEGAIQHMNEDHADAVQRYAGTLLGATSDGWRVEAIDPDGADLLRGDEALRLPFPAPVYSAAELRAMFAQLGRRI